MKSVCIFEVLQSINNNDLNSNNIIEALSKAEKNVERLI